MPNLTPVQYRQDYEIYPGKVWVGNTPEDCRRNIELQLHSIGRYVATDYGHSLKKKPRQTE